MEFFVEQYDVIVIGAGHAGIEAALVSGKLGCKTAIFTINMDAVGNCPCNPSIGGTAKGHLVREIDALGGEMGKTADLCCLQSRMLNLGKGPAVHSLRVQIDRNSYSQAMKYKLETAENVYLRQAEVVNIEKTKNKIWKIRTRLHAQYAAKSVIIATGTYLDSKVFIGDVSYKSGPDGIFPSSFLGESLKSLGLKMRRFKTGTPARVLRSSINLEVLEEQHGDKNLYTFSHAKNATVSNKVTCHIAWTNDETKKIILENIHRSPLFCGEIKGIGPRYCPSIEDKMIRFPDKERHQLFIEPCGLGTQEMYLQGMSSSLPEDVQLNFYKSIKGLENVVIMRPAYAIEYDCVDPLQMNSMLEFIDFAGLYGAGQFNGSSGYEEAAAQGLISGINAALHAQGKNGLILNRANSYIGTLIDDLVTKGTSEPYRMMTSRSEHRLILRQDNADERLMPTGRELGLIDDDQWKAFLKRIEQKDEELCRIRNITVSTSEALNQMLVSYETNAISKGVKLVELLKRPRITYEAIEKFDLSRPDLDRKVIEKVEIEVKYEGYIKKQAKKAEEMHNLDKKIIPNQIDYKAIKGLRIEAIEKLSQTRPENIGQASRISGVSPADISVLMIWIKNYRTTNDAKEGLDNDK